MIYFFAFNNYDISWFLTEQTLYSNFQLRKDGVDVSLHVSKKTPLREIKTLYAKKLSEEVLIDFVSIISFETQFLFNPQPFQSFHPCVDDYTYSFGGN